MLIVRFSIFTLLFHNESVVEYNANRDNKYGCFKTLEVKVVADYRILHLVMMINANLSLSNCLIVFYDCQTK
jgi:hypothetical protein